MIELASDYEIQQILHSSWSLWGVGMTKEKYLHFTKSQLCHPWSKRNFKFLAYKSGGKVVSSCKLYQLELAFQARSLPIFGLGAVFTPVEERGKGHAAHMLNEVQELAREAKQSGLLLFSDIGEEYYESLDYEPLGSFNFVLSRDDLDKELKLHKLAEPQFAKPEFSIISAFAADEGTIDNLERHHRRWLRKQNWGLQRSHSYWSYKFKKQEFLQKHCPLGWPPLEIVQICDCAGAIAFALIECADKTMRVLEVMADNETAEMQSWQVLYEIAGERNLTRIRGWEGAAPDWLREKYLDLRSDWSEPMFLPLDPTLVEKNVLQSLEYCPLLEFDHF